MDLINRTALVAKSIFAQGPVETAERSLMVVAKATFSFDPMGRVQLETQNPVPLYASEVTTPLGVLPSDFLPRVDPKFEVVLLGKAYAKDGKPVPHRRVALAVGDVRREIDVYGDRQWNDREGFTAPEPFTEMPLVYARAFGGSFDVLIDEGSKLRVTDPTNSEGMGFDIETYMSDLGQALKAPEGYPKLLDNVRPLPNLEHPDHPIKTCTDAPPPVGWAAVPPGMGLRHKWALDRIAIEEPITQEEIISHAYLRAHPDWIIDLPEAAALIEMVGVVPFETVVFRLPRMRPVVDILSGTVTFSSPLEPQTLVLLPDELRFYVVYRTILPVQFRPNEDRGMRLRTEERWSSEDDGDRGEEN
jgi:hypothetical protein